MKTVRTSQLGGTEGKKEDRIKKGCREKWDALERVSITKGNQFVVPTETFQSGT